MKLCVATVTGGGGGVPPNLQDARKFDSRSCTHKNIESTIPTGERMRVSSPQRLPSKITTLIDSATCAQVNSTRA